VDWLGGALDAAEVLEMRVLSDGEHGSVRRRQKPDLRDGAGA